MSRRKWNIETIKQVVDGEQPFIQVGYTGKENQIKRKIGEEWTDGKGKTWKKTQDGKVSVNKQADLIREAIKKKCSVCGARIDFSNDKLDHKMFPKTGKCYECLEAEEMKIRISGKWDEYEQSKVLRNQRGALNDFRDKVLEAIQYLKNDTGVMGEITQDGEIISFTGKCNPQWLVDAENDLIKIDEKLKEVNEEIEKLDFQVNK